MGGGDGKEDCRGRGLSGVCSRILRRDVRRGLPAVGPTTLTLPTFSTNSDSYH